MILLPSRVSIRFTRPCSSGTTPTSLTTTKPFHCVAAAAKQHQSNSSEGDSGGARKFSNGDPIGLGTLCSCGRRHFIEAAAAAATALLPSLPSNASGLQSDYRTVLNRVHPPRPDWYEELFASVLNSGMKPYEAEVAAYKSELFANLRGKVEKVLELGVGTGPNLKYYATDANMLVYGVDPNRKMEKYARVAAVEAGLQHDNFKFIQAVGESIPLGDGSVDAVIGTLVLCSVKDVDQTLQEVKRVLKPGGVYLFMEHVAAKDGTFLRFLQGVLDPLQEAVADGCHLTKETGREILKAGFGGVDLSTSFISNALFINPHVYGIARK